MPSVSLFRAAGAILAESIWWDAAAREVRWCDITAGTLHRSPIDGASDGSDDVVGEFPPPLSAFQPISGGGVVAALESSVVRIGDDGALSTIAELSHSHLGIRLNEGKCDPFGAFVVGSMDLEGDPDGALYRVRADGSVDELLGGLTVANGFEWSADGRVFYFTDTSASTVYRAPYSADGPLGEPEPFLTGHPSDGLTLDVDGGFWNGAYGDGVVLRWSPEGDLVEQIDVPAPNVTSVAFGGDDLSTLFIATARENLTEQQLEQYPQSGSLFRLDTTTHGRPVNRFGDAGPAPEWKD